MSEFDQKKKNNNFELEIFFLQQLQATRFKVEHFKSELILRLKYSNKIYSKS